jgi:hypothetical protein
MFKYCIVVSSHNQERQLSQLLASLTHFVTANNLCSFDFVVTESGDLFDLDFFQDVHPRISVHHVPVPVYSFWSLSNLIGLRIAQKLTFKTMFERIVLMNVDVLPSSWEFLFNPLHTIETSLLVDNTGVCKKSGYNMSSILRHHHLNIGIPFDEAVSAGVFTTPTRLLSFSPNILNIMIKHLSSISQVFPHYCADYLLTSRISRELNTKWLMRCDFFIEEDISTTGIKSTSSLSLLCRLKSLFATKSVYNLRNNLLFPFYMPLPSVKITYRIYYVFIFYIGYLLRLVK